MNLKRKSKISMFELLVQQMCAASFNNNWCKKSLKIVNILSSTSLRAFEVLFTTLAGFTLPDSLRCSLQVMKE